MGKVPISSSTTEMKIKKKKGRPLKNPTPLSTLPKPPTPNPTNRRSTRRNPNHLNSSSQPEFDEDDDKRKEKKVKVVVRLPQTDENIKIDEKWQQQNRRHSRDIDSGSGSESGQESGDREVCAKKRKINDFDHGSDDGVSDQEKVVVQGTCTSPHGSPLESGPTTPLPDKKLLIFILDRLQKKDTYGVFSEPVDPNELPDYFEIIEQPMDFGTVRKKLDNGVYKSLEELEVDLLLICSNAMQYNSADTVYYRQARTILDLAKRDFINLKHEGDDGELQPKVVRRGRPPNSKNQKKPLETSPVDLVGNEQSSVATLTKEDDKTTGSNSYNLRKGPALYRFRTADPYVSFGSKNGENYSELMVDWNNEFPVSILRADMKYGKKQFTVDENRRDTYRQFHSLLLGNNPLVLPDSVGNMKRLVPVGLQEVLAYAGSLARYAANLGPIAWKLASRKIDAVLPAGVQYGPGWVGDKETPSQTSSSFSTENHKLSNSTTTPSAAIARKFNSQNGFSVNVKTIPPGNDLSSAQLPSTNHIVPEPAKLMGSKNSLPPPLDYQMHGDRGKEDLPLPVQQRHNNNNNNNNKDDSCAPDLNIRVPVGSHSSSSLQIGSPPQLPDLALQLSNF